MAGEQEEFSVITDYDHGSGEWRYIVAVGRWTFQESEAEKRCARLGAMVNNYPALLEACQAAAYWFLPSNGRGQGEGILECGHCGPVGAPCCRKCAQKKLAAAIKGATNE